VRLTGWYIDGYGVFRDYEVRGLRDGLTIFLGPNEAGKSTLLSFVSGVLFGFPQRRGQGPLYPPLNGGRHGGRLFLAGADGEVVVERGAGDRKALRITLPGGERGTEDDLRRLVGHVDATLYRTIFAFDLHDLHSFETLKAEGIRDRIFSAGIAGAGASARQVIEALKERQAALLRPRARAQITDLLEALIETQSKAAAARSAASDYPALVAREDAAAARVAELAGDRDEAEGRRREAQALLDLWPLWRERAEAEAELERLEPVEDFPDDAGARLAAARAEVRSAVERREKLIAERDGKQARVREMEDRRAPAPGAERVAACVRAMDVYLDRRAQLPEAEAALSAVEDALAKRLRVLGEDWDEARARSVDGSIPAQEAVRAHEAAITESDERANAARRELDAKTNELLKAAAERERLAASIEKTPPPEPALLDARERAIRELRAHLAEAGAEEARVQARENALKDSLRALDAARSKASPAPSAAMVASIAFMALLIAAAGGWLLSIGKPVEAGFLGIFALMFAVTSFLLWRYRRSVLADEGARVDRELRAGAECEELARNKIESAARLRSLREAIAAHAAALGIAGETTFAAVEEQDAACGRDRTARERYDAAQARVREIAARERELGEEVKRHATALEAAAAARQAAAAEWARWKRERDLPEALMPRGALDFFRDASAACDLIAGRDEARRRRDGLAREIAAWEANARAVCAEAGVRSDGEIPPERLPEEIGALARRCREDEELGARIAALAAAIAELDEKIEIERGSCARAEEARDALFAEGGAADEAEFRARLSAFEARRELKRRIADREGQIAERLGAGPRAEAARAALAAGEVDRWREVLEEAEQRIAAAEAERDAALDRVRDAERARRELEASADVAALQTQSAAYAMELDRAVRSWRVAAAAAELIARTLGEFARGRQPAVLAEASALFAVVTDGAYERIIQTDDGAGLKVVDRRGAMKGPEQLSRGTAEQLYLCLRLGLIAEFGRRHVTLPVIMDDVLVNFDIERARAVAAVLGEFARDRQALLFTCHHETVAMFQDAAPGTRVLRMERLGVARDEEAVESIAAAGPREAAADDESD